MPWFSIPYTFSIHESPVTCVQFYSECPSELLAALHCLKTTHHHEPNNQSRRVCIFLNRVISTHLHHWFLLIQYFPLSHNHCYRIPEITVTKVKRNMGTNCFFLFNPTVCGLYLTKNMRSNVFHIVQYLKKCYEDLNPFLASAPILYPLKTIKVFFVFRGYEIRTLAGNWLKDLLRHCRVVWKNLWPNWYSVDII